VRLFGNRDLDGPTRAGHESAALNLHARPVKADHLADGPILRGRSEHRPFVPNKDPAGLVVFNDLSIAGLVIPDVPRRYATRGSRARFVFLAGIPRVMTRQQSLDVNAEVQRETAFADQPLADSRRRRNSGGQGGRKSVSGVGIDQIPANQAGLGSDHRGVRFSAKAARPSSRSGPA
jgi:hypothetical protein